jgi:spore maturation protein CgeB
MRVLYHILYPEGMGDDRFIYEGYKFAFESAGHTVRPLTERDRFSDVVRDFSPDLFITRQAVVQDRFVGNAREFLSDIAQFKHGGGRVLFEIGYEMSDDVVNAIKSTDLATAYFIHGAYPEPPFRELTGKDFANIPLAASRQYHFPVLPVKKFECDIVYIGANLPRKREAFKRRLLPLMKKYDVRVYGGDWDPGDRYIFHPLAVLERRLRLGSFFSRKRLHRQIRPNDENKVYASAKISLNFHEDNPVRLANGRTFKIPACGGFEICDWEPVVRKYFAEDEVIMPKSDQEWFSAIEYYLTHPEERKKIKEKATANALANHMYDNRAKALLSLVY